MTLTPEDRVATLSPRELDVARLAARGFSARYIARRYGISDRTVETHTRHIYEKLLVSTRDALIESFAGLLLARGGDIPTPHFAARPASSIPVGVALAPVVPLEAAERLIRAATRPLCDAICDATSGGSCFTPWCRCSCHKAIS